MQRRRVLYVSIAGVVAVLVLGTLATALFRSGGTVAGPLETTPPLLTTTTELVPVTGPTLPTTSGPGKALEAIAAMNAEIESNLAQGGLAFNHPPDMALGETLTIQLVVDSSVSGAEVAPSVTEPGIVITADIEVAAVMQALLVGRGFDIAQLTPETQPLRGGAEWLWQITAIDSGSQQLALTVNALIEVTESGTALDSAVIPVEVFERTIDVQVGVVSRLSGFLGDNFFWLGPLLILPLAGIGWDRVRRRFKKAESVAGASEGEQD